MPPTRRWGWFVAEDATLTTALVALLASSITAGVAFFAARRQNIAHLRQIELDLEKYRSEQVRALSEQKLEVAYKYATLRQTSEEAARDFINEVAKETAIGFLYYADKQDEDYKAKIWVRDNANLLIGRSASCDVILTSPYVSREHCILHAAEDKVLLLPLNPTNPVFVNGTEIGEKTGLSHQDVITLGDVELHFFSFRNEPPQEPA